MKEKGLDVRNRNILSVICLLLYFTILKFEYYFLHLNLMRMVMLSMNVTKEKVTSDLACTLASNWQCYGMLSVFCIGSF